MIVQAYIETLYVAGLASPMIYVLYNGARNVGWIS